jgi:hypothetical protein
MYLLDSMLYKSLEWNEEKLLVKHAEIAMAFLALNNLSELNF